MPHGKIQRVVAAKTASRHRDLGSRVLPLQIRQKLVDHVALVLHMPPDPRSRMHALVVPALAVHAVHAEHLDRARFEFPAQRADHSRIFILKKTSPGGRKNEDRLPGVPIHERLHVAPQFEARLFVIFAVHMREDCNRTARPSASARLSPSPNRNPVRYSYPKVRWKSERRLKESSKTQASSRSAVNYCLAGGT